MEILTELSLCYNIVYHYNGAQWYEQFLQVDRLVRAPGFDLVAWFSSLPSKPWCDVYFKKLFLLHFFTLSLTELSLVSLALDLVD